MKTGFIFEGKSAEAVLKKAWDTIKKEGSGYKSQRGLSKSIKAATFIITEPQDDRKSYPYWSKPEDDWYQDNFVKKETNKPPEILNPNGDIYTYKYAWRSRYFDLGYGYVKGVLQIFQKLNIKQVRFLKKEQLIKLVKETYKFYHPETVLAVLSWKGEKLLNFYLKNPQFLDLELLQNRQDSLLSIINELKHSPSSRRAITASFIYQHIDHSGIAGGIPVYQNYQLYVNFDKKGNPTGLTSLHLHRAIDAYGGAQLDINHDRAWGMIASHALRLPLQKLVIYANDVWANFDKDNKDLSQKTDIKSWLFSVTDSYNSEAEDIEKRTASPIFQKKIDFTLKKLTG